MDCAFGVISKVISYPRPSKFFPMLSSRSFIVFHFALKSMVHFVLIFVKGVKSRFFLHVGVSLFQNYLLKKTMFAPFY